MNTKLSLASLNRSGVQLPVMMLGILSIGAVGASATCVTNTPDAGCIHFQYRSPGSQSTIWETAANASLTQQEWVKSHFWEIQGDPPWFNFLLSWMPPAVTYFDLWSIHTGDALATEHPNWIMKDSSGTPLYLDYNCDGTTCSQWAGDFANPAFVQYQISALTTLINEGYMGVWMDNVDMFINTSNGAAVTIPPIDSSTGEVMTATAWKQHIADFCAQIRSALPNIQIIHNVQWYAGTWPAGTDPLVQQEILAADYINLERGVNDPNLVVGTSSYGMDAKLAFVDVVHSLNRKIIMEEWGFDGDLGEAGYFLVSTGMDGFSNTEVTPTDWYAGYDAVLGTPIGARYAWNGVLRRDFTGGIALMNAFGGDTVTLTLPGTYTNTSGTEVSSVTLAGGTGAVLVAPAATKPVSVPLTSAYNVYGINSDYATFPSTGGLDGNGYSYSSTLLGTSDSFGGTTYTFGPANGPSVITNATVTLPEGQYATLNLLGAGVNGPQMNQTFVVTYSDGSTSTFTQNLSDWAVSSSFSGETIASTMAYRDRYNGTENPGSYHVYGYSFALNSAKTVKSVKLPANANVVVLSMALVP